MRVIKNGFQSLVSSDMSFTRAHYDLYTHYLRSLDRNTTSLNQLRSIELSMYS